MLKTLTHALPSGYTELQYITSSGTQYIDTGIIPDNTTGFKVKMAVPETVSDIFRFGCRQNSSDTRFIIGTITGSAYLGFGNALEPIAAGSWAITQNTQFVAQLNYLNDRHAYINDIISVTDPIGDMSETTFTYPLIMFGRNSAGSITSSAQTIYSCEITKGSELVRNFIPAQNSSNVVGMYDTVTDTFFTNDGTGDFTAGPAVVTPTKGLREIHELYKRNSDGTGAEYIGELYKSNGQGEVEEIFSAGYDTTIAGASPLTLPNARAKTTSWEISGQSKQGLLPSDYTQLEYIESSGAQYIDTGIVPTSVIKFRLVTTCLSLGSWYIMQARDNSSSSILGITGSQSGATILAAYGDNNTASDIARTINHKYELTYDVGASSGTFVVTDITSSITSTKAMTLGSGEIPTSNIGLFGNIGARNRVSGQIHEAQIWTNGTLVRDFVPCKNSSNVLGMYDTVTGQFFTNAGTGTFTAGPALPTPTNPVPVECVGDLITEGEHTGEYSIPITVEGTSETTSTIYLASPLCKIGTYTDSIESDGTLTRGVGVKVFDGTENWVDASSGTTHIYYFPTADRKIGSDAKFGLCSHFGYSAGTSSTCPDLNYFYYGSQNNGFRYDAITSLADWQAYLATQYETGTPVTIYYPLATATESSVTVPTISTEKGTNYLAVESEVAPSNMSATYRKKTLA